MRSILNNPVNPVYFHCFRGSSRKTRTTPVIFWKDYCGSGAIYRMCLAGVHSLASFVGLFSTAVFSSAVDSPSARMADSRHSEKVSINLIAIRSTGTPNIMTAKMNNRRNATAVSMQTPFNGIGGVVKTTYPPRTPIRTSRSIPLNNRLCDADERNQTDDHQNLYQHGIPQPHSLLPGGASNSQSDCSRRRH